MVWLVSVVFGPTRAPAIAPGPYEGEVLLLTDVFDGLFGAWAIGSTPAGKVLVELDQTVGRGDLLDVRGRLNGSSGDAAGHRYGSVLELRDVVGIVESRFPPHRAGRLIRATVADRLQPLEGGRALLSGFLIGDISRISEADIDAMRKSGLAHFVAVSGSNVALFLGLLAVLAGPLAMGPRRRALVGLIGLPIYAAATRFEPSVMRASVMAGIALGGRICGIVLEAWQLLSLAVASLLLIDPGLTSNVGFQLSVAATAGVLIGARWPARNRLFRALAITLGAQTAVAPLLILHFGTVPLLSPLVNLLAAPLVGIATVLGAIGVIGLGIAVGPAAWLAGIVISLARGAAVWPQLGPWHLLAVLLSGLLVASIPRLRSHVVVVAALSIGWMMVTPGASLGPGAVAVLDVGQGDAILIHGGEGRYALVDGGPDPAVLIDRLRTYGVVSLELVVLTHVHADHATGLEGILGDIPIGRVWEATIPHSTSASREFLESAKQHAIPLTTPLVGDVYRLGAIQIQVEGPLRRYASPNDQSIVLTLTGTERSMLLAGDIETFAQSELDHLRAEVLKVPHQGAATSSATWLEAVRADEAIISVGPNTFGHPAEWVIDVLAGSGAVVQRTDVDGDVVVDLSE